ncbi:MAG: DUF1549 domain-containing protein, partial [Planctomycetota bacterium]|nr:DUF1549 domain-containing protein [Planctomycetota bacterium]
MDSQTINPNFAKEMMTTMKYQPTLLATVGSLFFALTAHAADRPIDFNRDIRPLLSNNCFACHGQDDKKRKADLRLDIRGALGDPANTSYVVPGDPDGSELYQRLISTDPDVVMPPPGFDHNLTDAQKNLIREWVEQGAVFENHWSFIRPEKPEIPAVHRTGFPRNEIDYFILNRLEAEGLAPNPEADKITLIRRVTFALTGLPPTPADVDAFLADESPGAYEKVVDRLLDSAAYGEHMCRYWLDVARYGDTHGLHLDNERSLWPYRDWVIDAFNRNLPFDRFTIEQLAGDLLPEPTLEQRIATGFNRCNVTTSEGGSIDEEYYVRYAVDRVETTSTVWMGLTMGCAVCHEHKYDPISQKEFYQLYAYFYSVTERAMDGNALLPPPIVKVPTPEQSEEMAALKSQLPMVQQKINEALAQIEYVEPENSESLNLSEP